MLRSFVLCLALPGLSPAAPTPLGVRGAHLSSSPTNRPRGRAVCATCSCHFRGQSWPRLRERWQLMPPACLPASIATALSLPLTRRGLPTLPLQHFNQIKVAPSQMFNLPCPCRQFAGHHLHPWLQGKTAPHSVEPDRIGLESVAPGCNLYLYHHIT